MERTLPGHVAQRVGRRPVDVAAAVVLRPAALRRDDHARPNRIGDHCRKRDAAPAVFGGFTVAREENVQRFHVSRALSFVLLIPNFEVETSAARKILPAQIARAAAIKNSANSSAITAAFASGNYQNLRGAFRDRLHQPYRKKLIPFLPRVITAAEKAGALGAFLSGSGSTIAAVTLTNPEKIAEAMHHKVENHTARTVIVSADNRGARLVQSPITSH